MRDQRALAMQCQDVERDGGSVIAFLQGLGFISPRATWERLQLNELGRSKRQLRDGRAKKPPKTAEDKKGREDMEQKARLSAEDKRNAIETALRGENPLTYLSGLGVNNPSCSWRHIVKTLAKVDPEMYERLVASGWDRPADRLKPYRAETPEDAVPAPEIPEKPEPEYIRYNPDEEDDPMPEAVPAVTEAEEPEEPEEVKRISASLKIGSFQVCGMEGNFGRYFMSHSNGKDWLDFESADTGDVLSLTIDNWRELFREFRTVAKLMGVALDD